MNRIVNVASYIVEHGLCCGCGACIQQCPAGIIDLCENIGGFLTARVRNEKCISCKKCLEYCPSYYENQKIDEVSEIIKGDIRSAYIGHAVEKKVRNEGQSGGVVTAILLYLMEKNLIDGAVTNVFDSSIQRSKAFFAHTTDEIKSSSGSYYTQSKVVDTVIANKSKHIAAVVLGCQAESLSLMKNYRPDYVLGLICISENSGHFIDSLVSIAKVRNEVPQRFRFKYSHPACGGWPGNVLIVTDKHRYTVDNSIRQDLKPLFESYRCKMCYDQLCINSDISFGDPWGLPERNKKGETVLLARTEKGEKIIHDAEKAGYITISPVDITCVLKGQTISDRQERRVIIGYNYCKRMGWTYPYSLSESAIKEISLKKYKISTSERVSFKYTRSRMLAKDQIEVSELTNKYQRYLDNKKRREKTVSRLLLPLRLYRAIIRRIKSYCCSVNVRFRRNND